jgi:hypothetical protein
MPQPKTTARNGSSAETLHQYPAVKVEPTVMRDWLREATVKNVGNVMASCGDEQRSRALGLVVTILTTAVGTAVFASLSKSPSPGWKIATGTIGFVAVIAGAVQTYMAYGKRSEQHRAAATKYVKLQRDIEVVAPQWEDLTANEQREKMTKWESELLDAETTAPILSARVLRKAEQSLPQLSS